MLILILIKSSHPRIYVRRLSEYPVFCDFVSMQLREYWLVQCVKKSASPWHSHTTNLSIQLTKWWNWKKSTGGLHFCSQNTMVALDFNFIHKLISSTYQCLLSFCRYIPVISWECKVNWCNSILFRFKAGSRLFR